MYNDYRVLKYATESSLLIELGFLSNEDDFKLLTDSGYQSIIAHDLANAIIYTLRNKSKKLFILPAIYLYNISLKN